MTQEAVCFKINAVTPWSVREKAFELTGKRFAKERDRPRIRLVVALVAGVIVIGDWTVAQAFDFFGLFGSNDTPPAVSRTAIPYSFSVEVTGDVSGLKDA